MWERNTRQGDFSDIDADFSIAKGKNSGDLYASNKKGNFLLAPIERRGFLLAHNKALITMIAITILVELVIYLSWYCLGFMGLIEYAIYQREKKKTLFDINIGKLFTIFKILLFSEMLILFLLALFYLRYFFTIPDIVSSLTVLNFYLFVRLLMLAKQIRFREVYVLVSHPGFYVWRTK